MVTVNDTIAAGKAWLRARLDDGERCPLCGQHAQMYKRKVNSGMARSLITMYRLGDGNTRSWMHVRAIGAQSREEGKLAYWGLVEEQQAIGLHGGRAGYWRVTEKGALFLKGQLSIPKYACVYNGKVFGFQGDPVTIRDALGTKFSYEELMRGI